MVQTLRVRGGRQIQAVIGSARLEVKSHGQKRFGIALKYPGEEAYRYLVATDLSGRTLDSVQAYTLRWRVEVFFEDRKCYEGWGQAAKQPGEEGSSRSLTLSLLLDHCLLLHPEQRARVENKLPACTVGSLHQRTRVEALIEWVRGILASDHPHATLERFVEVVKELFSLPASKKHMSGKELGRIEPTPSLKYRAAACMAG